MKTFSFYVYNTRSEIYHYIHRDYETENFEVAKEMFLSDPDAWRYKVLKVEFYIEKKRKLIEYDFSEKLI